METNALHTSGLTEPQSNMTVSLTNNRMEDSRWNRLLTILFTPQDEDAQAVAG